MRVVAHLLAFILGLPELAMIGLVTSLEPIPILYLGVVQGILVGVVQRLQGVSIVLSHLLPLRRWLSFILDPWVYLEVFIKRLSKVHARPGENGQAIILGEVLRRWLISILALLLGERLPNGVELFYVLLAHSQLLVPLVKESRPINSVSDFLVG